MPTSDTPKDSIIPPDELSMIHNAIDSFDSSENKFAARAARARELVRDSEDLHREIINRQEYSPGKGHSTDALPVQANFNGILPLRLSDFERQFTLTGDEFKLIYAAKTIKAPHYMIVIKKIEQPADQSTAHKDALREIQLALCLRHKNIVSPYGAIEENGSIFRVMALGGKGAPYRRLQECDSGFDENRAVWHIRQVADGLIYLHSQGITGCNIAPEYLTMSLLAPGTGPILMIGDFSNRKPRRTSCGTVTYHAPERKEIGHHPESVDIWALGVLTYELLCGVPGQVEEPVELYEDSAREYKCPKTMGLEAQKFIHSLLRHYPEDRITLEEVLKD